jgi:hypothetical protein
MLSEKADGKMAKAGYMDTTKIAKDIRYEIYIAGDLARAEEICEEFCLDGFCVTCEPTKYIYKYGKESGVRIGIINYARFPRTKDGIKEITTCLAECLLLGLNQGSYSIVGEGESIFYSRRECDI